MNIKFKIKKIFIMMLISILTSCYASGNLGVIQKINDADLVIESIKKIAD